MNKFRWLWRSICLVMIFAIAFSTVATNGRAIAKEGEAVKPKSSVLANNKTIDPLSKLDPVLREMATRQFNRQTLAPEEGFVETPILVNVQADIESEKFIERMQKYFEEGTLDIPFRLDKNDGAKRYQLLSGMIKPHNLIKVASLGNVIAIYNTIPQKMEYERTLPEERQITSPAAWETLRANAELLRQDSLSWEEAKAVGDGRAVETSDPLAPSDWFEMDPTGPIQAATAWARGYTGEGVKVAIIDDGVDFAHPDLMGRQVIYNNPAGDPFYNGWPMVIDAFSMRAYYYDLRYGTDYTTSNYAGVTYIDTSTTPTVNVCGRWRCFTYTPFIDTGVPGSPHTYWISPSMTKSGVVHIGTHPDESLRDFVWGEKVAVLVTDPNIAGVYDTVYVDLDADHDFRDEKPLTKANPANPATYNNMIAYRDMTGDGIADLSGGMLYFIADGTHYIPGMDEMYVLSLRGIPAPGNGDMIAMHGPWDSGYSHGTQCASNVVASGQIDGMLPTFNDLGPGTPPGAVYGAAPEAGIVPMNTSWSFSGHVTYRDAYYSAALGWDGIDQYGFHIWYGSGFTDTDAIQITSNSYGFSNEYNDGWDTTTFAAEDVMAYWAPNLQFLFSTGNGGPGYGTAAPPIPGMGIGVGASTEYGSTGWETITNTWQINYSDITSFSNSGPGARDGSGVDIVAGGAFAAGAEELNYYAAGYYGVLDGNISWATWGGTSRASPTAAGVLALIYQAYKDANGFWPTSDVAKAILMASATDINYDVFKQGAGQVNANVGTAVAGGLYGVFPDGGQSDWTPGDFRGVDYPSFAHITYPGNTEAKSFTLYNQSPIETNVQITTTYMNLINSVEFELDVTPDMVAGEYAYGTDNQRNFYKAFNYYIPITSTIPGETQNIQIPEGTDLMVVREIYPLDQYDLNGDYDFDNRFYLSVYNWTDINGDENVWEDLDANGTVNFINSTVSTQIDGAFELMWDDPRTELDRWEYARFDVSYPTGNAYEVSVQDPLNRMHDGLFIGLYHRYYTPDAEAITTNLKFRIEFYQRADVPWLSTNLTELTISAGSSADFEATVDVPVDMPAGDYAAAIEVSYPNTPSALAPEVNGGYNGSTIVIPVTLHVASLFDGNPQTLGGLEAYNYDLDTTYNNGAVRGYFDWQWREESGDWRAFYVDVDNEPVVNEVYVSESFDSGIPGTWTVENAVDTDGSWEAGSICGYSNNTGGSGEFVNANSDCHDADVFDTWLITPSFDLTTANDPVLEFNTTFFTWDTDHAEVNISTDGGANWTPIYQVQDGNYQHIAVSLAPYIGENNVKLAFRYDTGGDVWQLYWKLDDVNVADYVFPNDPATHVILRDEWNDAAPHTDIDTVVLGPIAHPTLTGFTFGAFTTNPYDESTYGPYSLSTVVQSNVARSGRSTWFFDTTSGANEEWLMWPLGTGGLHEILQHNVLFEGIQFDTVFTKTLGLLSEDVHELETTTFFDHGTLGEVTLSSNIPMNGFTALGYLYNHDVTNYVDEPISFTGAGTLEWVEFLLLEDVVAIDLQTSSADISDIDLVLFYCPGACIAIGESAGADANEHIFLTNPEDGLYAIAIDNYSGPAGTFNLTIDMTVKTGGITTNVSPTGPVNGDPVTVSVFFDAPLELGENYGVLFVGPLEAPYLKEIPLTIIKLEGIPIHLPLILFNSSDPLCLSSVCR